MLADAGGVIVVDESNRGALPGSSRTLILCL